LKTAFADVKACSVHHFDFNLGYIAVTLDAANQNATVPLEGLLEAHSESFL
jgi:hypothetical protein